MSNPAFETVESPYTAFRFEVLLNLDNPPAGVTNPICNAAFAECDGLEMTMEPKAIREGGNNQEQIHLMGPVDAETRHDGQSTTVELVCCCRAERAHLYGTGPGDAVGRVR